MLDSNCRDFSMSSATCRSCILLVGACQLRLWLRWTQNRHNTANQRLSGYTSQKINIFRTIILPVVLYGCETWSLTLRKERKLRVFENMVLRRIFGPRRDEVTGEWRRLHNEEINVLYAHPILYG